MKTPYRDGTTDVVFEPLDLMVRLAALVPPSRVNLTRYHEVFAPNHHLRERVTLARRGRLPFRRSVRQRTKHLATAG